MRRATAAHGLSLVEAMLASLLVALVLVSTMRVAGGVARSRALLNDTATAADLADGLLAEILNQPYTDPVTPSAFGLEAGETSSSKANYDDVDDYNGWTQTYAVAGRGTASDGYVLTVTVTRAALATPSNSAASETGLKRIRVLVTRQGRTLADRSAWKGNGP